MLLKTVKELLFCLIFTIGYAFVALPLAAIWRLAGIDPLNIRCRRGADSYYEMECPKRKDLR